VNLTNTRSQSQPPPGIGQRPAMRQFLWRVHRDQRLAIDFQITAIAQRWQQDFVKMPLVILAARIGLLLKNAVGGAMPDSGPGTVRPAQAEWKIRDSGTDHVVERPLQQALAVEPVVVITKRLDTIALRQTCLFLADIGHPQVIKTQVGGQIRLPVAKKQRLGLGGIGPLGKPLAPPEIVFRNGMKLRQIQGDHTRASFQGAAS